MSLLVLDISAMSAHLSCGIILAWSVRTVLCIAMVCCVVPNFYSVVASFFRKFSQPVSVKAARADRYEEELVAQQFRLCIAEGDHHGAFKIWQRAKSLEGGTVVRLVDVVHMLRALGKSHSEVVSELRSAFDCNPSLGDSAAEMLDDLRRRGMLGLLGKIICLLNESNMICSKVAPKSSVCDGWSSDDDASTQAATSECSTPSETSDDEFETSLLGRSLHLETSNGQISIAAFLACRPLKGIPPAGHLHAVRHEESQSPAKLISNGSQATGRWESLRPDHDSPHKCHSKIDRSAPWRKVVPDASVAVMTSSISDGCAGYAMQLTRASKPGSLSSSLDGSAALRPTRKL